MNNTTPYNDKGQRHGYWIIHYSNNNVSYKGQFFNGNPIGYFEFFYFNGKIKSKEFCI